MTSLSIFITAAIVYIAVVYLILFVSGLIDRNFDYDADGFIAWIWPLFLPFLIGMGIASLWRRVVFPKPLTVFCRRSLFYLSLPFRPVTLGRLIRERCHLS